MDNFADRLIAAVRAKGTPCVIGLDPRINDMPAFITDELAGLPTDEAIRTAIVAFHERVVGQVAELVPAVKLQVAFYEQYGLPGMQAFVDTIAIARDAGLMVLVDAKRNDIDSTAEAYANAYLGTTPVFGRLRPGFDVDAVTVNAYLGRCTLKPFVDACIEHGRGIFVLVRTSNEGSGDLQERRLGDITVAELIADIVDEIGQDVVGTSGYSSVGAVVGATWPRQAASLRRRMPRAVILVPGYGSQGGTGADAVANFNSDGFGAIINNSRSATYNFGERTIAPLDFDKWFLTTVDLMITDVRESLTRGGGPGAT